MMPSRPRFILLFLVALTLVLGALLFAVPHGEKGTIENPAPHAPDQQPK